jgi:hypothetical protein
MLSAVVVACCGGVHGAAAGALDPVLTALRWDESSDALKHHFGKSAIALAPPIEFGDAYVDVALRGVKLGDDDYVVYFEMDKAKHGLKRVLYERPRHAATQKAFDAAVRVITAQWGKPQHCAAKARPGNGYQAMQADIWRNEGRRVRIIFRDTTLEAENGCQTIGFLPCGLEGHLIIVIDPANASEPDCG